MKAAAASLAAFAAGVAITRAFWPADINFEATYGPTGMPKNCRAIVQANIDAFRAQQYSADEIMKSLERNCGRHGHSWRP